MTEQRESSQTQAERDGGVRLVNEFAEVRVDVIHTHNGVRLSIAASKTGRRILLCPLALEALTWQPPELFSELLRTPHGPE